MARRATDWTKTLDWEALTPAEAQEAKQLAKAFKSAAAAARGWPEPHRWMLRPLGLPAAAPPEPTWAVDDDALIRQAGTRLAGDKLLELAEVPELKRVAAAELGVYSAGYYDTVADALVRQRSRRDTLTAILALRARRLAVRRAMHEAEAWRGAPPTQPEFKPAWALLRSAVRSHTHLFGAPAKLYVITDPPGVGIHNRQVLWLEGPRLSPSVEGATLLALLDVLTHPAEEATRDTLLAALAIPRWERDLAALDRTLERPPLPEDEDKRELGWLVKFMSDMETVPVLCRPKKRGAGYVTRVISEIPLVLLTEQDERAAGSLDTEARLAELVDHPRVMVKDHPEIHTGVPVRVRSAELSVTVNAQDEGLVLGLAVGDTPVPPHLLGLVAEGAEALILGGEIRVFHSRFAARRIAALLQLRPGLAIPLHAAGQLGRRLPELAKQLPVEADPLTLGRAVDPDLRPLVRLTGTERGIEVEVRVQPIPEVPSQAPGEGMAVCVATRDGQTVHTRRDLQDEVEQVRAAIAPIQLGRPDSGSAFRWTFDDLPTAVAVVERARAHADGLRLTWSGERIRLASRAIVASDLSLRVEGKQDWFGLDGEVTIDGHRLRMAAVLEAALEGHGHVQLSDGQWAGLSEGLRAQLATAAAAAGPDGVALGPQHAALVDALAADGAQIEAPPRWFDLTRLSREARDLEIPLPDGLNATLRSYQREGFTWLARLAHWAPGACLADDMGLGKTLQTLALLLRRRDSPALVVAPTSVVANWARELERFAPSLRPRIYHGGGRSLDDLGPGDVVLTSYGVLVRDGEQLAALPFGTAVLDEAQAIKNPASQRAQAAYALQAGFRVALSGTPVENRTEELWSLFRFVSPGLLGSPRQFVERFAQPIARGDRERRTLLARVVAPFLLRRTKRQVERDLPERTELRVDVALSPAERTLYDRARMEALTRIQNHTNARFQVFEELLRLRRLACNPALVDPGTTVPSSKLRAVLRALTDLRDAGHRALVFSSFTSHLALVRPALESEGFAVRYLDGAMTARQRLAEVDAFQSGEGDVFLISLKAGGVGLNLTAATYVLHLDPWWNPAAEDQATDRAHRIGQTQPVTVLRFVALGTVEDQILRMHETKRELADALLSASGSTQPVTAEQLLALLAEVDASAGPDAAASPPTG